MMSFDVAEFERERRALILRSVDLLLNESPELEGKAVSLLMIQKGCIKICDKDESVIPRWVFSRASLGKLMKDLGFFQKRTDLRRYLLETKHTSKLLMELKELEELSKRSKLNLPKFLETFIKFKRKCLETLGLTEPLSYQNDLKLTNYMLSHMKKLSVKHRATLKPLLRKHRVNVELTVKELAKRSPWDTFPVTKRLETDFEPVRESKKIEPIRKKPKKVKHEKEKPEAESKPKKRKKRRNIFRWRMIHGEI